MSLSNFKTIPVSMKRQKGFTLLEGLVAFLILSIGMLGVASLQLISLKAGHTAVYRSVAVIKVQEMFERMRNNPLSVADYDTVAAADNSCNNYGALNTCTSAEMVAHDKFEWEQEITASMSANAGITTAIAVTDPVPGTQPLSVVTITVNWKERDPEDPSQQIDVNYSASADVCSSTNATTVATDC